MKFPDASQIMEKLITGAVYKALIISFGKFSAWNKKLMWFSALLKPFCRVLTLSHFVSGITASIISRAVPEPVWKRPAIAPALLLASAFAVDKRKK